MENHNLRIINVESFKVIGITSENSCEFNELVFEDTCGKVWRKFILERVSENIPDKIDSKVYAVYYDYPEMTGSQARYLVGSKVAPDAEVPEGMDCVTIKGGTYLKVTTFDKVPECHTDTWKKIWSSHMARTYKTDFEVYDADIQRWRSANMDVFIGISLSASQLEELPEYIQNNITNP
ncbi:GyrI-like domain-containing protein [Litoribacter ruber]|uniref:GyrI-like domain-containing protein n=1 Tax=Litoribacter ruber TaxID=702568 RepID=A0AAP2CF03_9BACT|nr:MULTISPECIES: GyrI-like domain-containing protein [Litoribacter]MBS9523248.1 GyrI-like domain-containing protein [Litoribacter alkaliphilus]MBT0810589.1 GyrI-like domain-containing protein [Litoribacter ruber]